MATIMSTLTLLILLASPAWAYVSPWDDCAMWNEDVASVVLCRKAKMGQWRWEQQRLLEELERILEYLNIRPL
jgi:hypothetical protein